MNLVESEEPKFKPVSDRASEEEKMAYYTDIGSKRILAMLEKANEKNPEGSSDNKGTLGFTPYNIKISNI